MLLSEEVQQGYLLVVPRREINMAAFRGHGPITLPVPKQKRLPQAGAGRNHRAVTAPRFARIKRQHFSRGQE